MKLLLTSYGITTSMMGEAKNLLSKHTDKCKTAFITTAGYGNDHNPQWFDKFRQELRDLGITDIQDIDLRDFTPESLEKVLDDKNVMYVNGGNTFFLMEYARKSGFETAVRKFLDKGGVYVGVSAGSIICGPTIETAGYDMGGEFGPDENNVHMTDLTAMNIIPFLINPHARQEYMDLIIEQSKNATIPQVILTDMQAVLVNGNETKLVGEGEQIQSTIVNIFPLQK